MGGQRRPLAKDAAALRELAKLQVNETVARHALALLASTGVATLDAMVAALEEAARLAPRAIGGFHPERLRAEEALEKLRQLRRSHGIARGNVRPNND